MSSRKVTPEKVFRFLTIFARIGGCLSPPPTAKNSEKILYEIYWWFCFCLTLSIILPNMYDSYLNRKDISSVLLNMAELCPLSTGALKIVLCKYNRQMLQACLSEMDTFLRTMTLIEREMLQSYIDKCIVFHYFMLVCIFCTSLGFASSPILLPQPYPAHTSYPFEVNTELLKNILRGLQMLALVQAGIFVTIDFVFSTFIWFTGARFELLSGELLRVSDTAQLYACIQKHQEILRFAKNVNLVSRSVAYTVACSTCLGTVTGAIQFLRDESLIMKLRFVTFVLVGCFELFVYCRPAENLIENSKAIGFAVYSSRWVEQTPKMKKLIYIIMQRARSPSIISVGEFLPILSLNFYGSFLSTTFSYFTTLRATATTSVS